MNTIRQWTADNAAAYRTALHGPDGLPWLDRALLDQISQLVAQRRVIDCGCGAGRFAIKALQAGAANVTAIDINKAMIEQTIAALASAGLTEAPITAAVGDVTSLEGIADASHDVCLCINVGCNVAKLEPMFAEGYRVLVPGGHLVVTWPDWLEVLFLREGYDEDTVRAECNSLLCEGGPQAIAKVGHVFRATIVDDSGRFRLVRYGEVLEDGTPMWRKIAGMGQNPGLVVPNVWHDGDTYFSAAAACGFRSVFSNQGKFGSAEERRRWNDAADPENRLGPMYEQFNPFSMVVFQKG